MLELLQNTAKKVWKYPQRFLFLSSIFSYIIVLFTKNHCRFPNSFQSDDVEEYYFNDELFFWDAVRPDYYKIPGFTVI